MFLSPQLFRSISRSNGRLGLDLLGHVVSSFQVQSGGDCSSEDLSYVFKPSVVSQYFQEQW